MTAPAQLDPSRRRLSPELQYSQLIASLGGIVWEADAVTCQMTFVSESAERMLGYPLEQWLEPNFWVEHIHPDDRTWVSEFCLKATWQLRPHDFEYRMLAADGRTVWLRDIVTVVAEGGAPSKLRGVMVDVTDRKTVEQQRQEHVQFLENLDRVNRAIQGATDVDGMMREVLETVLSVFDCDRAWLVYPCDPTAATWQAVMERTRPEYPGALQAGAELPVQADVVELFRAVHAAAAPVCFGPGSNLPLPRQAAERFGIRSQLCTAVFPKVDRPYLFGVHQCSHPREWSAQEQRLFQEVGRRLADALTAALSHRRLQDSEARFRAFVDHATDAFFLMDARSTVLDVNLQACQSLGYTREELVGKNPLDFDPAVQPAVLDQMHVRLDAGEQLAFDSEHRRKDGSVFPVEIRVRPFWEGGKRYAVALVRDVSDRRRLEEQFRQAQKMEAVGRLAGGIAHDFNNLLTVINCYSEMVFNGLPAGDPNRELAAEVQKAGERAATLTRQLLAFSRKQILQPQVVSLNAVLGELDKLLRRLIGEDVELVLRPEPTVGVARVDPGQFEQAVINLAVNARDAMPDGGRIVIATQNVELDHARTAGQPELRPGPYVLVSVTDTGHGMDEGTRLRIFEPFFTTKDLGKGTGLGLAMVYGFVKQSDGHIEVESEVGRGTTFRVYLPRAETVTPATRAAAQSEFAVPTGAETVLLVEDEESVRALACTILQSCGYTVLTAADGEEGLAVGRGHAGAIDLLVTDLVMPRMSGRRLVDQLRATRPDTRILFLSGYDHEAVAANGIDDPDVAFLHKPFAVIDLARKVREVLDARQP